MIKYYSNIDYSTFDLNGIDVDEDGKPLDSRSKFKLEFGGKIYKIIEMKKRILK